MTFLFGAGLPVLFPIAYLSLLNLYIVERLMMAYSYRKPPMYGSETNQAALNMMIGAPMIYCVFAMWMFSNQQAFEDVVVVNTGDNVFAESDHRLNDVW